MSAPLADRFRPDNLDDVAGQNHILGEGRPLRAIINSGNIPNLIFYGPSGTGKTTVSRIIANNTNKRLHKLNGTNISLADIKNVVSEIGTMAGQDGIILYIDEIQYLNRKQQQSLLEYIENGDITLITSTTENPYFYIYNAILSRSTVFEFKPVPPNSIEKRIRAAFSLLEAELGVKINARDDAVEYIAKGCGGDVRKAINTVELTVLAAPLSAAPKRKDITLSLAAELTQKSSMNYDKNGEQHYDLVSALQKSIRGSHADAALHYLARLLSAGDILSPCRRLLVIACEDIGLAYPNAIPIVKACVDSAIQLGMPEAMIPLANAVILLANAPKSNSAFAAVKQAVADVENGLGGEFPRCLQNKHFDGEGSEHTGQNYLNPHDFPNHYAEQTYLPHNLENRQYYKYGDNKTEQAAKMYWDKIKDIPAAVDITADIHGKKKPNIS
ncbi:MAG: replication-associated recombination protein A [Oscillospiraceae bacterium]|nr:replication-associated recombination protein A [Oscillospiraceae bacterium]